MHTRTHITLQKKDGKNLRNKPSDRAGGFLFSGAGVRRYTPIDTSKGLKTMLTHARHPSRPVQGKRVVCSCVCTIHKRQRTYYFLDDRQMGRERERGIIILYRVLVCLFDECVNPANMRVRENGMIGSMGARAAALVGGYCLFLG